MHQGPVGQSADGFGHKDICPFVRERSPEGAFQESLGRSPMSANLFVAIMA